ncbi:MAG: response regulator, partial [Candidatus Cloacimonetes bacterium]|nr:response regulator [Candidatus Cloacimonadota bacterium]
MKTIVVVDDEIVITENIRDELAKCNELNVICCQSGYEALNTLISEHVDLVITDIAMPDMNGYQLYSRIQELHESLPVIMMTGFGYDPNHAVVKAKTDGLRDVVFKPFNYPHLIELIKIRLRE